MRLLSNEEYRSRRSAVPGRGGVVASSQPLATQVGVDVLRGGGNAADAAVAVAAALAVTQPCSTGMGGDCFCLYYQAATGRVLALNGSGRSPAALSLETLNRAGLSEGIPDTHGLAVTVPGTVAAWAEVTERLGRWPLGRLLEPAVRLASDGFPVSPLTALWWARGVEGQLSRHSHGGELTIGGRAPRPGEIMRIPTMARTLEAVAADGPQSFYGGRVAARTVEAVRQAGGVLALEDLASHRSDWVDPISLDYRGVRVWECPPNGHGLAALIALNIARNLDLAAEPEGSTGRMHLLVECMRLAFADTAWHVADPVFYRAPVEELLSADYGRDRAGLVDRRKARREVGRGHLSGVAGGDTVYFCTADADGNACSFINSTFIGFGTGIVPEGCGFSLQNRGCGFVLEPGHPNCLEPGKRPYHTIIPGLATRAAGGALVAAFGVMGGMMQPQGHLQVISALVDDGLDPQAALDRPRFFLADGRPDGPLLVEDEDLAGGLRRMGHHTQVVVGTDRDIFGLGQIIMAGDDPGVLWAGSDPRGDGCALGLA